MSAPDCPAKSPQAAARWIFSFSFPEAVRAGGLVARNARPLPRDTRGLPHSPIMPLSCVTRSPTGRDARPRHAEPCGSIIRPLCPVMCDTRGLPHSPIMPLSCVTRRPTGRDARPRHAEPCGSIIRPPCPVMCDTRSSCRAKPNGTAFQNRPAPPCIDTARFFCTERAPSAA